MTLRNLEVMTMNRVGDEKLDVRTLCLPVAAGKNIKEATMVAIGQDGYAVTATKATGLTVAGMAIAPADNSAGAAGDLTVTVRRGAFVVDNSATAANVAKKTDILKICYIEDEVTVSMLSTGSSVAGTVLAVDDDGVTIEFNQPSEPASTGSGDNK